MPNRREYVFVSIDDGWDLQEFHDKAILLDPNDPHAPFPMAFRVNERLASANYGTLGNPQITGTPDRGEAGGHVDEGDEDEESEDDEGGGGGSEGEEGCPSYLFAPDIALPPSSY